MLFLWFSAGARRVSVPPACKRRRRYGGFQQSVVLKYFAESGHPWETFSSRQSVWEVWEEMLRRRRGEVRHRRCVLAITAYPYRPFALAGTGVIIGLTNIDPAACANVSQTEALCLNYFNSNYFIHMHSMYFSYRVRSESVG